MQGQSRVLPADGAPLGRKGQQVLPDVLTVIVPVDGVPHAVIGEAGLPDVAMPFKLPSRLERESALDELDGTFQRYLRAEQKVNVVRHDDKVMQTKLIEVALQGCDEERGPAFIAEEALAAGGLEADEISLVCLPEALSGGPQSVPSGAKAPFASGWLWRG